MRICIFFFNNNIADLDNGSAFYDLELNNVVQSQSFSEEVIGRCLFYQKCVLPQQSYNLSWFDYLMERIKDSFIIINKIIMEIFDCMVLFLKIINLKIFMNNINL